MARFLGPKRTLMILAVAGPLYAGAAHAAPTLSYAGRLGESDDKPFVGKVRIEARFYHAKADNTPIVATVVGRDIETADGFFQLDIGAGDLTEADFAAIFPSAAQDVWIEIRDATNNVTYPKQRYSSVPFALRIPVDDDDFDWSAGRLTLKPQTAPAAAIAAEVVGGDISGTQGDAMVASVGGKSAADVATGVDAALGASSINANDTLVKRDASGVIGVMSVIANTSLKLKDGDGNFVALKAHASMPNDISYVLPPAPESGKFLTTDANGNLSWNTPAGAGDITDVVAGTGLTGGATAGSATLQVDVGTADGKIVQVQTGGALPALSGASLTNLDPAALSAAVSIAKGGTGATSDSAARTALGLVPGSDVQAYDADLGALAGLGSNGIIVRTGSGTVSARSLAAGSTKVTIGNADGVSGNPSIDISEGNIAINSLNGDLASTKGGTGISQTLAGSKVMVSNGSSQIVESGSITTSELDFLDGVTSGIQGQIDNKIPALRSGVAYFGSTDSDVTWKAAGVVKMTLKAGGEVGIGTGSPTSLLQLADGAVDTNANVGGVGCSYDGAGCRCNSGFSYFDDADDDGLVDASECRRSSIGTGKGFVGINTASPAYPLDISHGTTIMNGVEPMIRLYHNTSMAPANIANGFGASIKWAMWGSDGSGYNSGEIASVWKNATAKDSAMTFSTAVAGNLVEKVRIDPNGNVGIGTSTPGGKLDVQGGLAESNSNGGPIILHAQDGNGSNKNGGTVELTAGAHTGTGVPGMVKMTGGLRVMKKRLLDVTPSCDSQTLNADDVMVTLYSSSAGTGTVTLTMPACGGSTDGQVIFVTNQTTGCTYVQLPSASAVSGVGTINVAAGATRAFTCDGSATKWF